MLYYDRGIRDERPEVVRLESGVSLEVFEEGLLVSVVVRICVGLAIGHLSIGIAAHKTASPIAASSKSPFASDSKLGAHLCASLFYAASGRRHWSCADHYVFY